MAEVKLKEETELWEPRGPCGSWGPAEEHTHSEAWKLTHFKEEPQEFPFHMVTVKTEDDEDKSSVLHQRPTEENREETNGWDCGAEAGCSSVCEGEQLNMGEELLNAEDDGAESDWSWEWEPPLRQTLSERRNASTMEPKPDLLIPSVKQKLPVAPVSVKTEDDEDKSSVLHQRPTEKNREETNGWDCGAEAGCSSDPLTQFHSDSEEEEHTDSSEDTDHSEDYSQEPAPAKRSYAMIPPEHTPYSCSECGKRFRWKSHLQEHMLTHSGEKAHKCPECENIFIGEGHLLKHLRTEHHMCTVCEVCFPDDMNLKEHLKTHVEDGTLDQSILNSCPECGKEFANDSYLKKHMMVHNPERHHKCSGCEKIYSNKYDLARHKKYVHHICPVCKEVFPNGIKLKEHLKIHVEDGTVDQSILKSHSCSECGKEFRSNSVLQEHMLSHSGEKPHKCPECGMKFRWKSHLAYHKFSHSGEKPHKCPKCGMKFTRKAELKRHLLRHTEVRPHQCSVCEQSFILTVYLTHHLRNKHHMCPVCEVCFPDDMNLKEHLKIHEDGTVNQSILKSHSCSKCGKEFLYKSALKRHMVVHSRQKPSQCPVCEKRFSCNSYLTQHLQSMHHICPVCKEVFPDFIKLKEHLRTHVEDVPVDQLSLKSQSCSECGKKFLYKSSLDRHMIVHTGKKPHKCSVCEKHFSHKSVLTRHLRSMHHICPVCEVRFPDDMNLKEHLKTHVEDKTVDQSSKGRVWEDVSTQIIFK